MFLVIWNNPTNKPSNAIHPQGLMTSHSVQQNANTWLTRTRLWLTCACVYTRVVHSRTHLCIHVALTHTYTAGFSTHYYTHNPHGLHTRVWGRRDVPARQLELEAQLNTTVSILCCTLYSYAVWRHKLTATCTILEFICWDVQIKTLEEVKDNSRNNASSVSLRC